MVYTPLNNAETIAYSTTVDTAISTTITTLANDSLVIFVRDPAKQDDGIVTFTSGTDFRIFIEDTTGLTFENPLYSREANPSGAAIFLAHPGHMVHAPAGTDIKVIASGSRLGTDFAGTLVILRLDL